jgi:hypothetical protein
VLFVLSIASLTVCLTVVMHLALLRKLAQLASRFKQLTTLHMASIVIVAIIGHLVEIFVFATALAGLAESGRYGTVNLEVKLDFESLNYFYLSALTYTSLGFSDHAPKGPLRLFVAMEAVTGLVLITWTAALGTTIVNKHWRDFTV